MKKNFILLCILILSICAGCASSHRADTITQASTIDILLAGVYDGEMSLDELLDYGDFGIGTFDRLDGEMIVLDGKIYQVRADGRVYRPQGRMKTPFAAVTPFDADISFELKQSLSYEQLQRLLDEKISDPHLFYAIRVNGKFSMMHTRSVPAQEKPYPPLAKVAENQPEFEMTDIPGTIIGFRCPEYVKGINVPGYHLHFLSEDRLKGGHILGFQVDEGIVEIDGSTRFTLVMPEKSDDRHLLDLSRDRSRELEQVEK